MSAYWILIFIALTVSVILFFILKPPPVPPHSNQQPGQPSNSTSGRKSLSTLHREKKEQQQLAENKPQWRPVENGKSDENGSKSSFYEEDGLRTVFHSVLTDIIGPDYQHKSEYQLKFGDRVSDPKSVGVPAADRISNSPSIDRTSPVSVRLSPGPQILLTPKSARQAIDREALLNSRERILDQVRKARIGGTYSSPVQTKVLEVSPDGQHRKSSIELQTIFESTLERPLRSILKKQPKDFEKNNNHIAYLQVDTNSNSEDMNEPRESPFTNLSSTCEHSDASKRSFDTSEEPLGLNNNTRETTVSYSLGERVVSTTTTETAVRFRSDITAGDLQFTPLNTGDKQRSMPSAVDSTYPLYQNPVTSENGDKLNGGKTNGHDRFVSDFVDASNKTVTGNGHITSKLDIIGTQKVEKQPHGVNGDLPDLSHALSRTKVDILENGVERLKIEENVVCKDWDPYLMMDAMYKVNYVARPESKKTRFINMEGHLEHLPIGLRATLSANTWKKHYFKTKEGRLQWFQRPYADDFPLGDVLLAGADVDINRDECVLQVHGGKDASHLTLRSPSHLLEKWRQALLSHAASSIYDCYVQPFYPPVPHHSQRVVIIELGSCSIRAGLLTEEPSLPSVFFPAIAAVRPDGEIVVGSAALKPEVRHGATLVHPIRSTHLSVNKYTIDMNVLKHILRKIFADLEADPAVHKVLLSVPQNAPVSVLSDVLRSLLSDLHVQRVALTRHPCLVLYAYDVTTGVVVDVGERLNIVPIVDGYVVQNAIVSLAHGSGELAQSLKEKLCDHNVGIYAFMSTVEKYILRYVSEQACYIATDFDEELEQYNREPKSIDTKVSLQNYKPTPEMIQSFTVGSGRFTAPEGLLHPKRWGLDVGGLQKLIFNAIQSSPMDSRRTLYRNIHLAGGCTLLPGLAERLEIELEKLVAPSIHVQVHMSPWRYHAAYLGAQVLAASAQFDQSTVGLDGLDGYLRRLQLANF